MQPLLQTLHDPKYAEVYARMKGQMQAKSDIWKGFMFCCHNEAIEMLHNKVPLPPYDISIKEVIRRFEATYEQDEAMYDGTGMIIPQKIVDAEIAKGLMQLFDTVLASKLLTKIEHRFHYDYMQKILNDNGITDVKSPTVCPCANKDNSDLTLTHPSFRPHEHYGVLHLFRLIFRLPEFMPVINVAPESLEFVYSYVERLVEFILAHFNILVDMKKEYRNVPEQYSIRSADFHPTARGYRR